MSERHRTLDIFHGFNGFLHDEAPRPEEAVSDESLALLHAFAISFDGSESIYEYSNKLFDAKTGKGPLPRVWIRIDGAHFMRKWRGFLAPYKLLQRDRTFLMGMIGALVTATSLEEAEEVLTGILTICSAKYDGDLTNGQPSLCKVEKAKMIRRLTGRPGKCYSKH